MLTLVLVAVVFSVAAVVLCLHIMVVSQKMIDSCKNWAQSLSDDCNAGLQSYYDMVLEAMKKDTAAFFDEMEKKYGLPTASVDVSDMSDVVQYIEEADVKIN